MEETEQDVDQEEQPETVDDDESAKDSENEDNASSSELSSDVEMDNEGKLIESYLDNLKRIDQNKYNYEEYVQLTKTALELNDLDMIRQSHELFATQFPLTPTTWFVWIECEAVVATTEQEKKLLLQICRRALNDYYCPNIASLFAQKAAEANETETVWAEILGSYSFDCRNGAKLFDLRREFINKTYDEPQRTKLIVDTYIEELGIPLFDLERAYIDFKVLCEKQKDVFQVEWAEIDTKYEQAKEQIEQITVFEDKLAGFDEKFYGDLAKTFKEYIRECQSSLAPSVLQTLYERMVASCCLNENVWLDYVEYIQDRSGRTVLPDTPLFQQTDMAILGRALRNCPWSGRLQVERLRAAEEHEQPKKSVQNLFEEAIGVAFDAPQAPVSIWLAYLSYLRRHTDFAVAKEVEILRKVFALAWDTLGRQWGVLADCNCEILQFWGRLEYTVMGDPVKGKELWTTVMASANNPSSPLLWNEFADLELAAKGVDNARRIFRKAITITEMDYLSMQSIVSAWSCFERCHGSLTQQRYCEEDCVKVLTELEARLKLESRKFERRQTSGKVDVSKPRTTKSKDDKRENATEFKQPEKIMKRPADGSEIPSKRPRFDAPEPSNGAEHRHEIDPTKDNFTVFMSNLDYDLTEDDVRKAFPELVIKSVDLIRGVSGRGRGFGFVEFMTEDDASLAKVSDRRTINGRPTFISAIKRDKTERGGFQYSESLEKRKLFVKGIPYDADKEELETLFAKHGEIQDIRIVYHKSGKPKGFAYVEYKKNESATVAVMKLDGHNMRDHIINVALSAPPPRKPKADSILSLGAGKRAVSRGEQKPRMSFIPRVVQKTILSASSKQ